MECETYECVWNRMKGKSGSNSSENVASDEVEDLFSTSSSFRILFPIVLVIGIFILVAIGVLIQRVVVKVIQKRWRSRRNRRSVRPRDRSSHLNARVNTITTNYSDLPTYGQVMAAIKQGEAPPPYCEVASGAVNPAFLGQHTFRSHLQSPNSDVTRQANNQWSLRDRESQNSTTRIPSGPDNNASAVVDIINEAQNRSTVIAIPQSPTVIHSHGQENVSTSNVTTIGPSVYRSTEPPIEQPVSIVIHDIDELVNSISVSSSLRAGRVHVKKHKKTKQRKVNETSECQSLPSPDSCVPKTSPNPSSTNNANESPIVPESTIV